MSYWDGTRWLPEGPSSAPPRRTYRRRFLGAAGEAGLITLLMFGLIAGTTFAAKPRAAGTCTVAGDVVSATGLPTDEVINFMWTDASGTNGRVLGITWEGWWDVPVAEPNGPTTYEFASRTFGKSGAKYWVFASCSTS